jgi:FKBP-type peptidyl-prolyl cis-trans isomerase
MAKLNFNYLLPLFLWAYSLSNARLMKLFILLSVIFYAFLFSPFSLVAQLGLPPWQYNESEMIWLSSGVGYLVLEEGKGGLPKEGDIVKVHYLGMLESGKTFDNSFLREKPLKVQLGAAEVIPGWEEVLKLLPIGSKAVAVIPPEFAYGAEGMPPAIPPNAALRFYLEVVGKQAPFQPRAINQEKLTVKESGLQYTIFEAGKGDKITKQKRVTMHYDARLSNGALLGNTFDKGEPLIVITGKEQLFPGWEEGLTYLRQGDKATLVIPPKLGPAMNAHIPENESIMLQLEILKVEDYTPFVPYNYAKLPAQKSLSGISYYLVEKGKGKLPQTGEMIKILYHATLKEENEQEKAFDSAFEKGIPASLVLGNREALLAWDEILPLAPKGSKLVIVLPPEKVALEKNLPPFITPNSTIVFYIELLD